MSCRITKLIAERCYCFHSQVIYFFLSAGINASLLIDEDITCYKLLEIDVDWKQFALKMEKYPVCNNKYSSHFAALASLLTYVFFSV